MSKLTISETIITADTVSVYFYLKAVKKQFSVLGLFEGLDKLKQLIYSLKANINGYYGKYNCKDTYKVITIKYSYIDNVFDYEIQTEEGGQNGN